MLFHILVLFIFPSWNIEEMSGMYNGKTIYISPPPAVRKKRSYTVLWPELMAAKTTCRGLYTFILELGPKKFSKNIVQLGFLRTIRPALPETHKRGQRLFLGPLYNLTLSV